MIQFGETAWFKCRSQEGSVGDTNLRFGLGVWIGVDARTGQHIFFDTATTTIRHARTLMRLPDVEKFAGTGVAQMSITPWASSATETPKAVFADKNVPKAEVQADMTMKARSIYIKQADLDAFGYTPGCRRCHSIPTYGRAQGSMPHT